MDKLFGRTMTVLAANLQIVMFAELAQTKIGFGASLR
jgi:hypothetical protein